MGNYDTEKLSKMFNPETKDRNHIEVTLFINPNMLEEIENNKKQFSDDFIEKITQHGKKMFKSNCKKSDFM